MLVVLIQSIWLDWYKWELFFKQKEMITIKTHILNVGDAYIMVCMIMLSLTRFKKSDASFERWQSETPFKPTIPFKTFKALSKFLALKNTHARLIKLKVMSHAKIFGIVKWNFLAVWEYALWTLKAIPCNSPQMIKVQPAPCQNPPIKNTKIKFLYTINSFTLLPPKGIYKYSFKKY